MSLDIIARPLGEFLLFIYNTLAFHNYGLAILTFTLVVKLVLLPLTVKQYRSSAKMQELQPLIQEIQKRYKNDKEKLNQEMIKVYQENNYNPAGGCRQSGYIGIGPGDQRFSGTVGSGHRPDCTRGAGAGRRDRKDFRRGFAAYCLHRSDCYGCR
jgi:hypothetical protein